MSEFAADWATGLAPARRRKRWLDGACQVEGCTMPLEARFHKRHHICAEHLKAPRVAIQGRDMRFCQKCAKFEAMEEFEGAKRTCQRALTAHNLARQRRKQAQKRGSAVAGSGTGSESSVSAPAAAAAASGSGAGTSAAAAAAGAGLGAAGAGAAAPPPALRPASASRLGSQQASVAGLGGEAADPLVPSGLEDLLEVPALSSALWQAPAPAQQLLAAAPPAGQLLLASSLPSELLSSSGASLQAAVGQFSAVQQLQQQAQQQAGQAQLLAHPLVLAQQVQQAQQAQQQAAQAQQQQAMAPAPAAALMQLPAYVSPGTVHRISLKVFDCAPHELGPDIRAELESMLQVSVEAVEAAVRPGCVHLTVDLFLGAKASAAAATVSAAQLLAALRCPRALGAAVDNAVLLQWQGGVAGTEGGAAGVVMLPHAEPQLAPHPACIAAPEPGQLGSLVQLELQLPQQHASAPPGADPLAGGTVVCRQAGRHVPVEIWGPAASAAAALAAASALEGGAEAPLSDSDASDGDGGSDSDSDADLPAPADSCSVLERPWSGSSSGEEGEEAAGAAAATAGVWVRPVGLHPGRCELEVQLPLAGFAADGSACKPVLLSRAAPLLVLPCEAAAAEVRAFLARISGRPGVQHLNDLLRDIGTAVGFLWQQGQQDGDWPGSEGVTLPPGFVAEAAAAAADYVQHAGGMPCLLALLQRAVAAATAACEGAELEASQAAELAQGVPSVAAQLSSGKSRGLGSPAGSGPSDWRQPPAAAAASGRSYFDGDDEESNQHCTPAEQLELEAASWGPLAQEARRMPNARVARWAAAVAACFLALVAVRLVLLAAQASGHGGRGAA